MKPFKTCLILFSALLFLTILPGCKHTPGTWINDKIDNTQRQKFHELNHALLEALKANNVIKLGNIMSKEFMDGQGTNRLIEFCSIRMRKTTPAMLDEYYMVHATPDNQSVKSFKYDVNSYTLSYDPLTREKYIAFFVLKQGTEKWMLTANYNKYKYGWKVDEIEINPYTMDGKTAPELYKLAQDEYDKKHLVNAVKYMSLARQCALPSVMWKYDEQENIDAFYSKTMMEAENTYSAPLMVKQVPTIPAIIRVFTQDRGEGNSPIIWYLSKLNLKDTAAVKKEHQLMRKLIPTLIPGLDQGNKIVYYIAFNHVPDIKDKKIPRFEFTDRY